MDAVFAAGTATESDFAIDVAEAVAVSGDDGGAIAGTGAGTIA